MKYTLALLLIARTALAGGGHDHGHGHDHGEHGHEETELTIVEEGDYHMHLKYYVSADKHGDKWLNFESTVDATRGFTTG